MRSQRTSRFVLAGVVGLAGLGVGMGLQPAVAATGTAQAVTDRVTAIKNALAGLVKDGTLTQEQADKVATTLDQALPKGGRGPGGRHGVALETAASVIGVTVDELRTALAGGKTLAQVAEGKGVSQSTLVEKLVAAEKARIAEAVKAGRLTQAQADAMTADLTERITRLVTSTRPAGGRGPMGEGRDGQAPGKSAPGSPGTTSPSATS